jgi:amino acid adenylation domain-containing protein
LGEVEHYLKLAIHNLAHIAVDQIFLPRRDSAKVLAAFLCSDGKEKTSEPKPTRIPHQLHSDPTIWTSGLAISLPAYMIPTMFIFLDWMPLTSSGKTDRRRLQEVARRLTDEEIMHFSLADAEKRSPVTEMEMRMQSIWAIVLSIPAESIGLDDSFVRLGGDSLTAMRLAVIARQAGISIMVDHIFKNPTLGAMASVATTLEDEVAKDLKPFSLLRGAEPINAIMSKLDRSYGIPMESVEDIYPTSSLQEGLMILSVRQPGTYSFQWISALPPTVDRQRFINAWKKCVKRNTILRTRIIYTELSGSLQVVLNDEDQWTTSGSLNDFLKNDKLNFMDYGKPLTRWAFVDDESGKSHFVWSAHHSIYDGWALPMVLQEVALIYQSTDISHLPAPAPYARFIEYLEHKDKEGEEAWWRLHFPEDKVMSSFPPVQSSAIQPLANVTVTKDIQFSGSLSSGFTTSTLIRAAWAIVLSRYSESNDALFGALLAGRNVPIKDIATMTGPTITTVPVHVHVKPDQSIHSFLESVQNQAIEMMPYEHMGLQNIKRISRKTQEACNFQNLLVIQPRQERNESNYLWRTENTVNFGFDEFLTFPLVFQVELGDKSLSLTVKLDDRLLTAERGQRMLEHFSNVIIQLDKESNKRLSDVEITSSLDFTDLQIWNDMSSGLTSLDTCVHDLISEQARLSPDASAICSWDVNFTYAELDSLSSRVAGHLSSLGVGLETYVLLCFDKSAWAIVAMLGVLKSGAAYVAIDPTHPVDRKEFISRNVAATVAMTSLQHRYMFESLVKHVVGIDRATVEKFATNFSLQQVPSSNPAFVVFTSGSTGTPKGIVMEHGAFSTGARAHASALNINRHARVFQFAAYTYDVSMGEIFSTLMHGGCICVPSEDERLSNLANAINKMKATWLFLTPTVAALLQPSAVKTLQYLILGGEHATASNINSWAESVCLINSYGPAECAIWTNCTPGLASNADPSNIGRCIGSRLWIVEADNHNKLTPLGCVGELVVESPSLARGYLNDLVKTTDAFIETPKWAVSDSQTSPRRMYKTGDLAKYNFDGTLSIVGRKDTQVKLNGQRMELGEVEHHLWADKHVSKAMAVVPNAGCCMKHLVAIISLHHLGKVSNQQFALVEGNKKEEASAQVYCLREHLASKLPKYMVPTLWVVLEDLPLNASGKLDRRLVTEWVKEMDEDLYLSVVEIGQGDKVKSQPLNEMERLIRGLWAKILNISEDRIGMDDNFLQAGGDSISAVRLSAGARHAGILLLVRDIFLNPTLRAMSAAASWEKLEEETIAHEPFSILETEGISTRLEDIAIETNQELDNIEDVLEASDYQSWALSAGHLKTRGYLNYFGIKFDGELDLQRIQGACRTVIAHHPILRTVFVMRDQRVLQVILKNYNLEFTFYERQDDSNDGISHALIREVSKTTVQANLTGFN